MLNDYSPSKLMEKWGAHLADLPGCMTRRWEAGRPRKRFFLPGALEPDAATDQMTPQNDQRILLYEGYVVIGHFARAFFPAYIPGEVTHYGSVVYCIDPAPVEAGFKLAWRVNLLRKDNAPPPAGTEAVAKAIRDDRSQFARIMLPAKISGVEHACMGNICIQRTRLPFGYIHDRLVPLLIAPQKTEWCMLLPLRFWDDAFKAVWCSGEPANDQKAFHTRCQLHGIKP
jgi:hypothetical protein